MSNMQINMSAIEKLMDEAYLIVKEHHGSVVDVDYDRGRTRKAGPSPERAQQAAISRDLLRMSALLQAAAAEAGITYHAFKGWPDPRAE